jgi:hypothetical protein
MAGGITLAPLSDSFGGGFGADAEPTAGRIETDCRFPQDSVG